MILKGFLCGVERGSCCCVEKGKEEKKHDAGVEDGERRRCRIFFAAKQRDLLWRLNLGVMKEIICGIEGVLHI
jgi:hypothetical protein